MTGIKLPSHTKATALLDAARIIEELTKDFTGQRYWKAKVREYRAIANRKDDMPKTTEKKPPKPKAAPICGKPVFHARHDTQCVLAEGHTGSHNDFDSSKAVRVKCKQPTCDGLHTTKRGVEHYAKR